MRDEAHKSFHALPVQLRAEADQVSHQCVDLPAMQQLPVPQCRNREQPQEQNQQPGEKSPYEKTVQCVSKSLQSGHRISTGTCASLIRL